MLERNYCLQPKIYFCHCNFTAVFCKTFPEKNWTPKNSYQYSKAYFLFFVKFKQNLVYLVYSFKINLNVSVSVNEEIERKKRKKKQGKFWLNNFWKAIKKDILNVIKKTTNSVITSNAVSDSREDKCNLMTVLNNSKSCIDNLLFNKSFEIFFFFLQL